MAHYMVHKIENVLDTRDKRYMFLKLLFPNELPMINLEGTPRETAFNIVDRFIKNCKRTSSFYCRISRVHKVVMVV